MLTLEPDAVAARISTQLTQVRARQRRHAAICRRAAPRRWLRTT
jgi:hypothetical protein